MFLITKYYKIVINVFISDSFHVYIVHMEKHIRSLNDIKKCVANIKLFLILAFIAHYINSTTWL